MRMVGSSLLPERTEQFVATEEDVGCWQPLREVGPHPAATGVAETFERAARLQVDFCQNESNVGVNRCLVAGARSCLPSAARPRHPPRTLRLADHARVCWLRAALLTSRTHPCLPSRPSAWRERIDLDAIARVDRVIEKSVAHVSSAWRKALTVAATPVNPQIGLPVVSTNILTAVLA
jgi:hypothetical protein